MVKEARNPRYNHERRDVLRDYYKQGRRNAGSKLRKGPYTGIPTYIQEVKEALGHGNVEKKYVMKDLGLADNLVSRGVRSSGEEFRDAVKLYNLAIAEAEQIGDEDFARRIYDRAMKKLDRAKKNLSYSNSRENYEKASVFPMGAKKSKLEESLRGLEKPGSLRIGKLTLTGSAAVVLGIFGLIFIFVLGSITGSVIGAKQSTVFEILGFIFVVLFIYFIIKRMKKLKRKKTKTLK